MLMVVWKCSMSASLDLQIELLPRLVLRRGVGNSTCNGVNDPFGLQSGVHMDGQGEVD